MNLRRARRIAIIAIIVSLSIAALIGIITLLGGDWGQYNETPGKVLLTTLLLAVFSISLLCHLAVVGRALQLVGFVGVAVSTVAVFCGLLLTWGDWDNWESIDHLWRVFGVFGVLAISFAHANLLLLMGQRRNRVVRTLLYITVALIALVALLLCLPIATAGDIPGDDGEAYWRLVGVVAILDVLGSIVLPITGRFLRDERLIRLDLDLPAELDARLTAAAATANASKAATVVAILDKNL